MLHCGVAVLAAMTSRPVSEVQSYLVDVMAVDLDRAGTTAMDLVWAFRRYGYELANVASYDA
jgi:hypothetical protein